VSFQYDSETIDLYNQLRKFKPFSNLTDNQVHAIAIRCFLREFKSNEVIYSDQSPCAGIYFLLSGSAALYQKRRAQAADRVRYIPAGQIFGYTSFTDKDIRNTSAKTLEACQTAWLGTRDLEILQLENPKTAILLYRIVIENMYNELDKLRYEFHELATRLAQINLNEKG